MTAPPPAAPPDPADLHGPAGSPAPGGPHAGGVTARRAFTALGLVVLSVVLVAAAVVGVHVSGLVEPSGATLPVVLVGLSVVPVVVLYLYLVRRHRTSWTDLGFRRPTWRLLHLLWQAPLVLLMGALVQGAVTVATTGGTSVPRAGTPVLDELATRSAPLAVLALVATVVVAPLWEEVLFRGAVLQGFLRRRGPVLSAVLSAVVFAACHGFPPVMPYLFVLGLALAWVRLTHGTLWASVVLHAVNNAVVSAVTLSAL